MTADEVAFAGGKRSTTAYTWYYYNSAKGSSTGTSNWWLLSPCVWLEDFTYTFGVAGSNKSGSLSIVGVSVTTGVRPVISLKSCVKTSGGDGSASNPYTILETTSGC